MKRLLVARFGMMAVVTLLAGVGLMSGALATQATPSGQVIYDSTVMPLPGNLPSVGAEAYAFKPLGDAVTFTGAARNLTEVTVTLSSWGCQSGHWTSNDCATTPGATLSVPITFNIYGAGSPTPGLHLATRTQTFSVPYRALAPTVTVGSKPFPDTLYQDTSYAGFMCSGGTVNSFSLDSPTDACWDGYVPAVQLRAFAQYDFTDFFQPVDMDLVNSVKAGSAIPVKFSLGGDQGLDTFAPGYPKSIQYNCSTSAAIDVIEETVTAGGSSLKYDAGTGQYIYVWKTDKAWARTCRQLQVKFDDGTTKTANFKFTK